jgi:hypothetical protein
VKTRHDYDDIGYESIDELVRKAAKHDSAGVPSDDSIRQRVRSNHFLGPREFRKKLIPKALALALIPIEGRADVRDGLRSVDQ